MAQKYTKTVVGIGGYSTVYAISPVQIVKVYNTSKGRITSSIIPATSLKEINAYEHLKRCPYVLKYDGVDMQYEYMCPMKCGIIIERGTSTLSCEMVILTEPEIRKVICELVLAIYYMHEIAHCAHMDLSSGNVMRMQDGSVKIADFGNCLANPLDWIGGSMYKKDIIEFGCVTLWYRPPELLCADLLPRDLDARVVDIWSLGVIFGELLGDKCQGSFIRSSSEKEMETHFNKIPCKLQMIQNRHGESTATLLRGMLARDTKSRLNIVQMISPS